MHRHVTKRVLASLVFVGAALAVLLLYGFSDKYEPADAATLPPYVQRYLELLNAGDEAQLRRHLGNSSQPQDAAERIEKYGRLGLHDPEVAWRSNDFAPDHFDVTIHARTAQGEAVVFEESVVWCGDQFAWLNPDWHWSMGSLRPLDERLVGEWREQAAAQGHSLRIGDLRRDDGGWYSLTVTSRPFSESLRTFYESDLNEAGTLVYTSVWYPMNASSCDALVYDYETDTITLTTGCRYDRENAALIGGGERRRFVREDKERQGVESP